MNNYKRLPPFKWFCLTNFPFIEADFDALTNYELLCKVVQYLNEVIVKTNELGEQVEILTNWFENLDVQDEIDHKLDEMVESGELQEIISEYLNSTAIFGFDTVSDMKNATNLINGSFAKTMGYHTKNDGGSANYKIRTITTSDTVDEMYLIAISDTLVAEIIDTKITPEMLGAYGDGVHDDSDVIEKYFENINEKEHVKLYKNYGISKAIKFPSGYGITIDGGTFTALENFDNTYSNSMLYIPDQAVTEPDGYGIWSTGLRLTNMTFICNWNSDGIELKRGLNVNIDNCLFLYYQAKGIYVSDLDTHDLNITNCQFRGNGYGELYVENVTNIGIHLKCADSIISSCIFASGHMGINCEKGANIITNCHFYSHQNHGHNLKLGSFENIVSDCYFDGCSLYLSSGYKNHITNCMFVVSNTTEYIIKVSTDAETIRQATFWIDNCIINDERTTSTATIDFITYDNNITSFANTIIEKLKKISVTHINFNNPFNDIQINDVAPTIKPTSRYVASVNATTHELGTFTEIDGETQYYKCKTNGNIEDIEFIGADNFYHYLITPIIVTEDTRVKIDYTTSISSNVLIYDSNKNYIGYNKAQLTSGLYYIATYKSVSQIILKPNN